MSRIMTGSELMAKIGIKSSEPPNPRRPMPINETERVCNDWTDEETSMLVRLWGERIAVREIAVLMGRTFNSVKAKRAMLNLPKRSGGDFRGETLRMRVSPSVIKGLDALCADRGVSRGEIISRMVRKETP